MSGIRNKEFGDRLSTADRARKDMQQRFQAAVTVDDPDLAERTAARQAISAARAIRLAKREAIKAAEAERETLERARKAADQEAREVAERELQLQQEACEIVERAERQVVLQVEQKVARDARYAARKERK